MESHPNVLDNSNKEAKVLFGSKKPKQSKEKFIKNSYLTNFIFFLDNKFISEAINSFKEGDDMLALSTLYNLTSELSMANDTLAEDPQCQALIQELIILFDKFFLPDITLYSLQCLNFLLDLNPAYTSTVKKYGGMPKIVLMTQNIEFIDLAEMAIKAIEKMSLENPFALLECDAFCSVLNLIDFFDLSLKKSALKACINMTLSISSYDIYNKFIFPAVPSLTGLTKFNQNDSDHSVSSSAILCFFYIFSNIKAYNLYTNDNKIEMNILQWGVLDNLYEIAIFYLKNNHMHAKKLNNDVFKNILKIFQILIGISHEATNLLLNMNLLELVYSVLKREFGEKEENIILEADSENVAKEINSSKSMLKETQISGLALTSNSQMIQNSTSFILDIFPLLINLFPKDMKDQENLSEKIMAKNNKTFYDFFAEKIIKLLISNIISISSCSTLIQLVKLLIIFCKFSSVDQICIYLDPQKISHIIGKLLDTKETFYLQEVLTLLELLMQKVPENFISSFLREGIVENMKNFKFDIEKYSGNSNKIPNNENDNENDNENQNDYFNIQYHKENENSTQMMEDDKEKIYQDKIIVNSQSNRIATEKVEYENEDEFSDEMEVDEEDEEFESEKSKSPFKNNQVQEIQDKEVNKNEYIAEEDSGMIKDEIEFNNELKIALELSRMINENDQQDVKMQEVEKNLVSEEKIIDSKIEVQKEYEKIIEPIMQPLITNTNNFSNIIQTSSKVINEIPVKKPVIKKYTKTTCLDPKTNPEILSMIALEEKLKIFTEKYLSDSKIQEYLEKVNESENPLEIFKTLERVKEEIYQENVNFDILKNSIQTLISILIKKDNKLTLWEIEKSEVLLTLAHFLDSNFTKNYKNSKDEKDEKDEIIQYDFSNSFNNNSLSTNTNLLLPIHEVNNPIVEKLKLLFACLDNSLPNIIELIKLIQYTITSMNCFIVYFSEGNSASLGYRDPSRYITKMYKRAYKEEKQFKLKLSYKSESASNLLENLKESQINIEENKTLSQKITKYNESFLKKIEFSMLINQSETFIQIEKKLLTLNREEDILTKLSNLLNIGSGTGVGIPKHDEILSSLEKISNPSLSTDTNISKILGMNFFLQFELNGEKQKFVIEKTLTPSKVLDELKKTYKKEDLKTSLIDVAISFEICLLDKSCFKESSTIEKNVENNKIPENTCYSQSNSINSNVEIKKIPDKCKLEQLNGDATYELFKDLDYSSETDSNLTAYNQFEQRLFKKYYNQLIVCNVNLYEIKRLAPSLYILAILNLCLTNFPSLFNIDLSSLTQEFENSKVSNLLLKQVRDLSSISTGSIPSWCRHLTLSFPFISNFNSRYLFFKTCAFDPKRGMINLHTYLKNFSGEINNSQIVNLSKNKRYKIIVERNEILNYALKIQKEMSNFNGYIEFEYTNETGTGLGPTLEFYSLCIEKLREKKNLWYKTTDKSLFPAPINDGYLNYEENKKMFNLLGYLIARALYDDRIVDIPLSKLFWNLVLDRPINFKSISLIDSDLGNTIVKDFLKIIKEKNIFLKNNPNFSEDLGEEIKYNNMRIDEIGILFNLPGYPEIELKEDGLENLLTVYNIEEYVISIFDKLFGQGIKPLIESFKSGFNSVFHINNLKAFDSIEIEETLLGSKEEKWSFDHLYESIKPDHGYDKNSNTFLNLINYMCELDNKEKKKFLLFITGSPRLPVGGKLI